MKLPKLSFAAFDHPVTMGLLMSPVVLIGIYLIFYGTSKLGLSLPTPGAQAQG
jgi:hypothetical protein